MKKFIFGFILGAIIFGGMGVIAYTMAAVDIEYDNTKSGLKATNVQDAIDVLKTKTNYGNASAENILSDKKALSKGKKLTGTMPNNGAITKSLNPGDSYTIPLGYHDGSGEVTAKKMTGTYTFSANSTGTKTDMGEANTYRYVDATNVYNKGRSDASIMTGTYTFTVNSTGAKTDMGETNTYRYVDATNVYNKGRNDANAQSKHYDVKYSFFNQLGSSQTDTQSSTFTATKAGKIFVAMNSTGNTSGVTASTTRYVKINGSEVALTEHIADAWQYSATYVGNVPANATVEAYISKRGSSLNSSGLYVLYVYD